MTFKVVIFDLDLTLWNGRVMYNDTLQILKYMRKNNIPMYIASFHSAAPFVTHNLGIINYFNEIHYGQFSSKAHMISQILKYHPNVKKNEILFFDDDKFNIEDVRRKHGIRTIHVKNGIKWNDIPISSAQKYFNDFFSKVF